jgi:hypothetical protein
MTEEEWLAESHPRSMLEFREDVRYARQWQLFLCACARRQWQSLVDVRLRAQVELHESHADSMIPDSVVENAARVLFEGFGYGEGAGGAASSQELSTLVVHGTGLTESRFDDALQAAIGVYDAAAELSGSPNKEYAAQAELIRDIFGNPFRPVSFSPDWRTSTAVALAQQMYDSRDYSAMPILADALQDAGCDNADVLGHCRGPGPHVRGCWVVDLVLGKE